MVDAILAGLRREHLERLELEKEVGQLRLIVLGLCVIQSWAIMGIVVLVLSR